MMLKKKKKKCVGMGGLYYFVDTGHCWR